MTIEKGLPNNKLQLGMGFLLFQTGYLAIVVISLKTSQTVLYDMILKRQDTPPDQKQLLLEDIFYNIALAITNLLAIVNIVVFILCYRYSSCLCWFHFSHQ